MPYVERITTAGKTIEVDRYYTSRYNKKGIKRGKNQKPTKAAQRKVNTRKALRLLRLIFAANFIDGDYHLNFGYIRKRGDPPRTKEQMRRDMDLLLRELRKIYKANGLILKYVHVMEIGSKGSRHHHLVINNINPKLIQAAWKKVYPPQSTIHFSPLNTNGDYSKLAAYLLKYTDITVGTDGALQGKRWNCSKNLVRPIPKYRIVSNRNQFYFNPKTKKGYYIPPDSIDKGFHAEEFGGNTYLSYRMVKIC